MFKSNDELKRLYLICSNQIINAAADITRQDISFFMGTEQEAVDLFKSHHVKSGYVIPIHEYLMMKEHKDENK